MLKADNKVILLSCKKAFIKKTITSIFLVGLLLVIPLFYSYGIDYLTNNLYSKAIMAFIILGILTLIYRFVEILNQKAYYYLYSSLYKKYMDKSLEISLNNSLYSLSRFSLSEYSNILSEDLEIMSEYYSTLIIRIVEILQFIYIIVYFFFINHVIGFITLIVSIFTIIFLFYYNRFIVKTNETRKNMNDLRISKFQEIFLSIKEIKGFNLFPSIKNDLDNDVNNYIKWNNKLNVDKYNLRQISLAIVDLFKIICLLYSIKLIINGYITLGVITIVYSYYSKLSELFVSIITLNESISSYKVAKKRIYKLFQYAIDQNSDTNLNDFIGNISFKKVLYGNINKPILDKVSFDIRPNTFNVLVGDKDASYGVFALLLKYNRKHEGNILLDDKEISEYNKENISNYFGFMLESPLFFNKSIKDNLLIFDNNFDNIISVCKFLKIDSLIMSLPDGYSTILYNNAHNISEDLRYMLSFARILLKKSKVILLEDFGKHLSSKYRQMLLNLLFSMKSEHTIIMYSYNINILKNDNINQIIFLQDNKLICKGKHNSLYKNNELYRLYFDNL